MQFIDLEANYVRLKDNMDKAVLDVLGNGKYILGPEVSELEVKLSEYVGVKNVIACANGTDALFMPLMAYDIKAGDCVFCPSFTFAATAEVVALAGATPIFVDIDLDSYNMSLDSLKQAIYNVKKAGNLIPKAIIAVDLFGLPANYEEIQAIADVENLLLIEDAAQSMGGGNKNGKCGSFGKIAATSFYPAKPLGCYGDGGAMFTNDDELTQKLRSILFHGKGKSQYDNVRIGLNSRLDTIQAAILLQKLSIFESEIKSRQLVADRYNKALSSYCKTPVVPENVVSAFAQYTIALKPQYRDSLKQHLADNGIPSMIYYPKGLHKQQAYNHFPQVLPELLNTDIACNSVISLPMHPYLSSEDQNKITETVIYYLKNTI